MVSSALETPLSASSSTDVEGNVDFKGRPAKRSETGRWLSASFIIGVEMVEYFAYYGVSANLITYFTGPLGLSTAAAAENVNVWSGICYLLPLAGAFLADSFLGRYRTVVVGSLLYILALGLLTYSVTFPSSTSSLHRGNGTEVSCSTSKIQLITVFISLYLVAIAQGLHKPCIHAFGADQFDGSDVKECKSKSSFFNWCNVGTCIAITFTLVILTYVQENLSWTLGFGIPCIAIAFALIFFLLGTPTYRFQVTSVQERPFSRITHVFVTAVRNRRAKVSSSPSSMDVFYPGSQQFKFLDRALLSPENSAEIGRICSRREVREAKAVLRLFPIWICCLVYGIVFSQPPTLFTKQGLSMDRFIGLEFEVPAASLQTFTSVTTILFLSLYDRILVPVARSLTGIPSGITMLQRIGTGMFFSIFCICVAALVEKKRLESAQKLQLLSVTWLIPQYLLMGISQTFTIIGVQEFFYDQVGTELKSIGLALCFTIFGVGSLLSGLLINVIKNYSGGDIDGSGDWFSDDPMKGHLDYFYWLLMVISVVSFVIFIFSARVYIYRNE